MSTDGYRNKRKVGIHYRTGNTLLEEPTSINEGSQLLKTQLMCVKCTRIAS